MPVKDRVKSITEFMTKLFFFLFKEKSKKYNIIAVHYDTSLTLSDLLFVKSCRISMIISLLSMQHVLSEYLLH